jgi:two-component system sensor histidine kinase/response regulator
MIFDARTSGNGGEKILIVEDSPTQAEQLCYILEKHDYQVRAARNGIAALAMIKEERPTLIISDILMPEMDGYELCRRIKSLDDCRDIPVILLTSLSDPRDVIKGLECGADNFITKPYEEEYLISRIRYLLVNRYQSGERSELPELKISLAGLEYCIRSDRRQILDLLLSTYEAAIRKNKELIRTKDELNDLNERLKSVNHDLEAFSSTVSHDLRSPLNKIYISCQAIEMIYESALDEGCKEYFRHIFNAAENMNKLISTLLEFSTLSTRELVRHQVDLSGMARDILEGSCFGAPQRRVTFQITEGITGNGDMRLLRVVLENLLGNALKYTSLKETAVIEFGVKEIDGNVTYYVRDNGAGFDMSSASGLFAPFKRLHTEKEFEGFGIGLSTVQRIIQRHEGRVWAEGETGKGAVFYFTLNP